MRAKDYIKGWGKRSTLFNNLIDWEIDRGLQVSKKKVAFDRKKKRKERYRAHHFFEMNILLENKINSLIF